MIKYVSYIIFILLIHIDAQAQNEVHEIWIDQNLDKVPFIEFVDFVERNNPSFKFYFFQGWVDQVKMLQVKERMTLSGLLDATLLPHNLHWVVSSNKQIIISRIEINPISNFYENNTISNFDQRTYAVSNSLEADEDWMILGDPNEPAMSPNINLHGTVVSALTDKVIESAYVVILETNQGVYSDSLGRFELNMPIGKYHLVAQGLEQGQTKLSIQIFGNADIVVSVKQQEIYIDEIVVEAQRNQHVRNVIMGVTPLRMKDIKELPTFLGETDIIKTLTLLPGVQSGGELSQGFNVRGSGIDQNLVLFNRMPIYNIAHLFGFSSAFNPDVISGLELYKSSIPAKYGGRIASVTDIQMKIGDKDNWRVQGGISPLTGRVSIEGPIIKEKTSLLLSGRSSYADWILSRIKNSNFKNSSASYYDLNARINHQTTNGTWDVSGYLSDDAFQLNGDTTFAYQNRSLAILYRKPFSQKSYGTFSINTSQYNFELGTESNVNHAFKLKYNIGQIDAKADLSYFDQNHDLSYGGKISYYRSNPGTLFPIGIESNIVSKNLNNEQSAQADIYISDQIKLTDKLEIILGLRWSNYFSFGPDKSYIYQNEKPREIEHIIDTIAFAGGDLKKYYGGPEYRISARYSISENTSFKLAYNKSRQYLSLLINSTTISPTAFWQLANEHIKPQVSDQISIGLFKNSANGLIETSVELYYKSIQNILDYKSGAQLVLNEYLETDLINAKGRGYGLELLIKKRGKVFDGWISYTYSRSFIQASSVFPEELINKGKYFPSYFDQPHEGVLVGNFKISKRISLSANATYSTGKPLTLPLTKYYFNNGFRLYYSARNEFRFPDYFRADIALNIKGNHKLKKKLDSSWSFSVYNITGRKNAYSIYFVTQGDQVQGYKLSIYGRPIATITYNFKF